MSEYAEYAAEAREVPTILIVIALLVIVVFSYYLSTVATGINVAKTALTGTGLDAVFNEEIADPYMGYAALVSGVIATFVILILLKLGNALRAAAND